MIKYLIFCAFSIGLIYSLSSCEYKPEGEIFTEIEDPDFSKIGILISDFKDSSLILTKTEIHFDLLLAGRKLYEVGVKIDGEDHRTNRKSFLIDPEDFSTGYHKGYIEVRSSSGSGSLADVAGAEQIIFSRDFYFFVNVDPPPSIKIDSVYIIDGRLAITWQKSDQVNIDKYELYKYNNSLRRSDGRITYQKTDSSFYIDSAYVGGDYSFYINSFNIYGLKTEGTKREVHYPIDSLNGTLEFLENNRIRYSWNRPAFYNNFEWLLVNFRGSGLVDPSDTTVLFPDPLRFGSNSINKRYKSKSSTISRSRTYYMDPIEISLGDTLGLPIEKMFYLEDINRYILMSPENRDGNVERNKFYLYLLDENLKNIYIFPQYVRQLFYSHDKKHLYGVQGPYIFDLKVTSSNIEIIKTYNTDDITGYQFPRENALSVHSISNDLKCIFRNGDARYYVNLKNYKVYASLDEFSRHKFSPQSSYIIMKSLICSLDSTRIGAYFPFDILGSLRATYGSYFIRNSEDSLIVIPNYNEIELYIYSTDTYTKLPYSDYEMVDYDFEHSLQIAVMETNDDANDNKCHIVNILTGEVLDIVDIPSSSDFRSIGDYYFREFDSRTLYIRKDEL